MKKTSFLVASALLICGFTTSLKAQEAITNIFKSGLADLNTVANSYLRPAGNSLSAGLGSTGTTRPMCTKHGVSTSP